MHAATIGLICFSVGSIVITLMMFNIISIFHLCIISEKTQGGAEDEATFHQNQEKFTFGLMKRVFCSKLKWFAPRGTSQKQSCWLEFKSLDFSSRNLLYWITYLLGFVENKPCVTVQTSSTPLSVICPSLNLVLYSLQLSNDFRFRISDE